MPGAKFDKFKECDKLNHRGVGQTGGDAIGIFCLSCSLIGQTSYDKQAVKFE